MAKKRLKTAAEDSPPRDQPSVNNERRKAVIRLLAAALPSQMPPMESADYTERMEQLINRCTVLADMVYSQPANNVLTHAYQLFRDGEKLGSSRISSRLREAKWHSASERSVSNLLAKIREETQEFLNYATASVEHSSTVDVESPYFVPAETIKKLSEFVESRGVFDVRVVLKFCHDKNVCSDALWQRIPASEFILGATTEPHPAPPGLFTIGRARAELIRFREELMNLNDFGEKRLTELARAIEENTGNSVTHLIESIRSRLQASRRMIDRFDRNLGPEITFHVGSQRVEERPKRILTISNKKGSGSGVSVRTSK